MALHNFNAKVFVETVGFENASASFEAIFNVNPFSDHKEAVALQKEIDMQRKIAEFKAGRRIKYSGSSFDDGQSQSQTEKFFHKSGVITVEQSGAMGNGEFSFNMFKDGDYSDREKEEISSAMDSLLFLKLIPHADR